MSSEKNKQHIYVSRNLRTLVVNVVKKHNILNIQWVEFVGNKPGFKKCDTAKLTPIKRHIEITRGISGSVVCTFIPTLSLSIYD